MSLDENIRKQVLAFQEDEISENEIYCKLAAAVKSPENSEILEQIADDELRHARVWQKYTQEEIKPNPWKVWFYVLVSRIFGYTFGIKLMERAEESAQRSYAALQEIIPEAGQIMKEEEEHECQLIQLLDEERLQYISSIVLGLNDALVELTGALAGLTLALQNTRLIALTGLITGIAASLSMGASEYLATKSRQEKQTKNPLKASVYTGITYIFTVFMLILPYLLFNNYYLCLAFSLGVAVAIVAAFTYYVSVAQNVSFRSRFTEMAGLSLSVAALSFGIGYLVRILLGVEV